MPHLLLLEPDRVLTMTYTRALEHAGYTVTACREAQQALHDLEGRPVDGIVLELQLTGHSGIEFLYELRSYPEWQDLPVILNTNLTPQVLQPLHETLEHDFGITVCLYKPRTSLPQLLRAVSQQLGVRS